MQKRTVNLMKCQRNRDKLCGLIQIENELDHGYASMPMLLATIRSPVRIGVVYGTVHVSVHINMQFFFLLLFFGFGYTNTRKHTACTQTAQRRQKPTKNIIYLHETQHFQFDSILFICHFNLLLISVVLGQVIWLHTQNGNFGSPNRVHVVCVCLSACEIKRTSIQ